MIAIAANRPISSRRTSSKRLHPAAGDTLDDAREDKQRNAVADALLGHLLAEPHDEDRAGRHGQDGHAVERPGRVDDGRYVARGLHLADRDRQAEGLEDR